mgnify:CR=1 FL=1
MLSKNNVKILDLTYPELRRLILEMGEPEYRAAQLSGWIYHKFVSSYAEMCNLPQQLRERLQAQTAFLTLEALEERLTADGRTSKILFRLRDGRTVESTFMIYDSTGFSRERRTVCVSTQAGCALGCRFCATGQQGFERNLFPGEILEQILFFARRVSMEQEGKNLEIQRRPVTNVVLMGMGEPLANYENVRVALEIMNSKEGLGLGARQITLSTAGLVPGIKRLARENLHVELAVSLHAPDNELRNRLMPINRKYPLDQLIQATREYLELTGRRPTFEYALFQGVNDSLSQARALANLLKGLNCSVNLIIGNPTGTEFRPATLKQAIEFEKQLRSLGINVTLRDSRGTDIEAGCGQLRGRKLTGMAG